jgi:hypothetical protein
MQLVILIIIYFVCTISVRQLRVTASPVFNDIYPLSKVKTLANQRASLSSRFKYLEQWEGEPLEWIVAVEKGKKVWNELQSVLKREPRDKSTGTKLAALAGSDPWRVVNIHPIPLPDTLRGIFKYLNLQWNTDDFYIRVAMHDHKDDLMTYYQNFYNVRDGIIIGSWNEKPKKEPVHWSQVTFELWSELARLTHKPVSNLKWIVRHDVTNTDTQSIIHKAYSTMGIKSYPSIQSWTLGNNQDDAFYALLGTVNGKGVAHLLKDYSSAFRRTTIQEIFTTQTMDTVTRVIALHMVFRLGPVGEAFKPIGTNVNSKWPYFTYTVGGSTYKGTRRLSKEQTSSLKERELSSSFSS